MIHDEAEAARGDASSGCPDLSWIGHAALHSPAIISHVLGDAAAGGPVLTQVHHDPRQLRIALNAALAILRLARVDRDDDGYTLNRPSLSSHSRSAPAVSIAQRRTPVSDVLSSGTIGETSQSAQ